MKPLLISYNDQYGGAARAAYRLHRALVENGIDSRMKVRWKQSDDWTVEGPSGRIINILASLRPVLARHLFLLQKTTNNDYHSGDFIPSNWAKKINESSVDVVNLHWVAGETMSIGDIGRIRKPVVWSLHDMWPFSGAEHISDYSDKARWRSGYLKSNRPVSHTGFDLDRYVWMRKLKKWKHPMHIVAPSQWLADCARDSSLFNKWPVTVIPNLLNTDVFQILDRKLCRRALGLPSEKKIILFGSIGGSRSHNKGFDLLLDAMRHLERRIDKEKILSVVFGQSKPEEEPDIPFMTHWAGHIYDDETLCLLYNAADLIVVPSRQESFGQVASEALACGCPVVAFDCTGLRDVVDHFENGYLAKAYNTDDLADGVYWILEDQERRDILGQSGRKKAINNWSPDVVVPQYLHVFEQVCKL